MRLEVSDRFLALTEETPTLVRKRAVLIKQHIEVLKGQLFLLDSLVRQLDSNYKTFLAAHPQ